MKVIQQIADHLLAEGRLGHADYGKLVARGLIESEEEVQWPLFDVGPDRLDSYTRWQIEEFERRCEAKDRRRRTQRRGAGKRRKRLAAHREALDRIAPEIEACLEQAAPLLRRLAPVVSKIERVTDAEAVARCMARAPVSALQAGLRREIRSPPGLLGAAWDLIGLQEHERLPDTAALPKATARALRLLVQGGTASTLGHDRALLKLPLAARLHQLARSQRRLLEAFDRLGEESPGALERAMQKERHDLARDTLALVRTVRVQLGANQGSTAQPPPVEPAASPRTAPSQRVWALAERLAPQEIAEAQRVFAPLRDQARIDDLYQRIDLLAWAWSARQEDPEAALEHLAARFCAQLRELITDDPAWGPLLQLHSDEALGDLLVDWAAIIRSKEEFVRIWNNDPHAPKAFTKALKRHLGVERLVAADRLRQ